MTDMKILPNSVETEQSIIAAVILAGEMGQPDTSAEVFECTVPDEFYKSSHQIIMETAREMHQSGKPLDLISLKETLEAKGLLSKVGGAVYLAQICDKAPVPPSIKHYCRIIKDKASRRRLIQTCRKTIQEAFQGQDAGEIIDSAQREILKIDTDAQSLAPSIDVLLGDALDRYERLYKMKGQITGVPSGYPDLDFLTSGFQPSDLIILAARPSMGKSALVISIMAYLGKNTIPCGLFSLEMSKEQVIDRMAAVTGRVNSMKFRNGRFQDKDWEAVSNAFGELTGKPIYIEDSPDARLLSIRKKARQMIKQGVKILFIDYLQLITGSNHQNRNLEISEITRGLKLLARDLQVPIVLLSQLSRKCEERNKKRPLLSDLRDSGAIEQDADVVLFLFREEVYAAAAANENGKTKNSELDKIRGQAELIIAKQRNGPTGAVQLSWNAAITRFDSAYLNHKE
jgi:replicative DNA helicase